MGRFRAATARYEVESCNQPQNNAAATTTNHRKWPKIPRCLRYHLGSMVVGGLVVGTCQPFRLAMGVVAFVITFEGNSLSILRLGLAKESTECVSGKTFFLVAFRL